jgi:hypothetical protein
MGDEMIVDVVLDFGDSADLDDYDGRTYHEALQGEPVRSLLNRLDAICRCQDVLASLPETTEAQADALRHEWDMVSAELRSRKPPYDG